MNYFIKFFIQISDKALSILSYKAYSVNELLAIAPLAEIRAEAAELTATPADALLALLTDVGIDWRIVSEKATRKDANGSEEFCRAHIHPQNRVNAEIPPDFRRKSAEI